MTVRPAVWTGIGSVFLLLMLAEAPGAEPEIRRIGVLPMAEGQQAAVADSDFPAMLAERLAERDVVRVVPPSRFAEEATETVDAQRVRAWSTRAGVDALIATRVESAAEGRDFDIEVRMGHSGALISEFALDVPAGADLDSRLEPLVTSILESIGYGRRLSSPPSKTGLDNEAGTSTTAAELGLIRKGKPVAIRSDELEVTQQDDEGRRLVFLGNVRVTQGDITLNADRLEAFYPKGTSKPEQLEANGHVRVVQGNRRARCEKAVYDSRLQQVLCRGQAELVQGCDTVRGSEIQFDLAEEKVRVVGAASVVIQSGEDETDCEEAAS